MLFGSPGAEANLSAPEAPVGLAAGSGYEGGDDVSGMAVERDSGAVIAHGRAGVCVRSGFLYVPQRHAGVQRGGDEGVAQGVRPDRLVDPGAPGHPPHEAAGAVAVHALAV